jgi:single stranded DNA-binding protein
MARGYSLIVLRGNLGHDPEVKQLSSGDTVVSFRLAVNRQKKGAEPETDWWRCNCYRGLADVVAQHAKKGDGVLVQGRPRVRGYTGRDGVAKLSAEVDVDELELLGRRDDAQATLRPPVGDDGLAGAPDGALPATFAPNATVAGDGDDGLPF